MLAVCIDRICLIVRLYKKVGHKMKTAKEMNITDAANGKKLFASANAAGGKFTDWLEKQANAVALSVNSSPDLWGAFNKAVKSALLPDDAKSTDKGYKALTRMLSHLKTSRFGLTPEQKKEAADVAKSEADRIEDQAVEIRKENDKAVLSSDCSKALAEIIPMIKQVADSSGNDPKHVASIAILKIQHAFA